jgi:hypothetical protein
MITVDPNAPRPAASDVSAFRVFENDALCATVATIYSVPLMLLPIALVATYFKLEAGNERLRIPVTVMAVLLAILIVSAFSIIPWMVYRVSKLKAIILEGPVVVGRIVERSLLEVHRQFGPAKQIPIFHITYTWNGEEHFGVVNCSRWSKKHSHLANLEVGDEVALIVDREAPSRFFIRDYSWS